jgi:hypothetical protein
MGNSRLKFQSVSIFISDFKQFSLKVAIFRFILAFPFIKNKTPKLHKLCLTHLQKAIKRYLIIISKNVIKKYDYKNQSLIPKITPEENIIWIFWWQGEDSAPIIVKNCIKSIRQNNTYKIHVLSGINYNQYVDIPDFIIQKFNEGKIGYAHFSDILRMALLFKKGGIWIDATVFCSGKIAESYFELPFFTCRNSKKVSYDENSFSWTPFVLGSTQNSLVMKIIYETLLNYWSKNNIAISYLFLDVVFEILYEKVRVIQLQMDSLDCNNENITIMGKEMRSNLPFSPERLNGYLSSSTRFYKLSWKAKFNEYSEDKQMTLYYHFINNFENVFINQ